MRGNNLKNKRFGQWTVIEKADRPSTHSSPSKPLYWKCKCDCGTERIIPAHNLRCKRTLSCGHDMTLLDYEALYNILKSKNEGRVLCDLSFQEFLEFTSILKCHYCYSPINWVKKGYKTSYNLDRKDNTKGYIKQNCVVCCPRCNFGKGSRYSYQEWYRMNKCFREDQKL